jgi:hypothetical protein
MSAWRVALVPLFLTAATRRAAIHENRNVRIGRRSTPGTNRTKILFEAPDFELVNEQHVNDRFQWPQIFNQMSLTRGAEIGVWKGNFSQSVLTKMPGLQEYFLVDPWRNLDDWNKPFNKGNALFEKIFNEAMSKTLRTKQGRDKVHVLRGTSAEVYSNVSDGRLDFVYIDGDHTLKGVVLDLMLWYDKVAAGGLICGDDYLDSLEHGEEYDATHVKSVVQAVAQLTGAHVRDMGSRQFGFIKPGGPKPEEFAAKVMKTLRSSNIPFMTNSDLDATESALKELRLI